AGRRGQPGRGEVHRDRRGGAAAMTWSDGPGPFPLPSVCLVVLDGWGLAPPGPGNAVAQANTPVFDELWEKHSTTQLTAGGRAVTVSGRYYAMDRDRRWERTQLAYDAIVEGTAEFSADSGEAAVRAAYERDETDEFIKPTTVGDEARIREGDIVVCFNFRPD